MFNDLDLDCFYFKDRQAAAEQLIDTLPRELLRSSETVVLGISEGGVYFADKVATALDAQMDILLTEAISAPNNPSLPIAMISETEEVVMHKALIDAFEISEDFVYGAASRIYDEEVLSYVYKYRKGKDLVSLKGKYVVLVDECIETGLTMMVALKSAIAREAKNIYIATPILDKSVYENLIAVCDGVFCPHKIQDYISIEYYFQNFEKLTFDEIVWMVERQEKKKKIQPDEIKGK
ncbi:phosphoribosyltransferase family protein [Sulfurovum sp. zt1-1]|uniref:Phosphoribosyltransferase family protein n=1 Tax=Sulfurovum zhangzhouensis TaxID=3019067 RepID=A0ABT7QWJ7_9BACT|nr:phosphoribosyltransferase family protein [Sulfurovum zhangzhouensis]MDM5271212.1 phosphoribosyltransferase family protein [Sulfurovum zhangzhouensis]